MATTSASPFLDPGWRTRSGALAIVQLSRDQYQPVYLHDAGGGEVDGYAEGAVLNTRFGSFPHSTLIGVPWGSQVRASVVDTGSRGRKRKRGGNGGSSEGVVDGDAPETADSASPIPSSNSAARPPPPPTAASGFVHILPPTPEIWTLSLPHRTQVVYTSDYSYILHRLRARPGTRIIEAGAGSGSFTHAAARAVYGRSTTAQTSPGHVFSFEFHNERYRTMQVELVSHGLASNKGAGSTDGDDGSDNGVVTLTNRDVYEHGFLLDDGSSPAADAVFLDLPAPWRALQHLTRGVQKKDGQDKNQDNGQGQAEPPTSALCPNRSIHLCTFSPCIEQVTRTVSMLRRLGWVDIDMVEVANKKILVYRERPELVSGKASGQAGGVGPGGPVPAPRDVGEAVARLKTIEARAREHNRKYWQAREAQQDGADGADGTAMDVDSEAARAGGAADDDDAQAGPALPTKPPWMEGLLTSRIEPEVKTHTSYLVFAVLPRAWTAADEAAAAACWPVGAEQGVIGAVQRDVRKEQKRQAMWAGKKEKKK